MSKKRRKRNREEDGDGFQDHLLPVCLDDKCQRSAIFLAKSGTKEWVPVLSDFQRKETVWSFVPGTPSQPLVLHLGDYNLDGFPDALVILRNTSGRQYKTSQLLEDLMYSCVASVEDLLKTTSMLKNGKLTNPLAILISSHKSNTHDKTFPCGSHRDSLSPLPPRSKDSGQQAFLLENVPCNNASCHNVGRMFHIHWDQSDLGAIQNAVMATFFDIYEDGILDMLVLSQAAGKNDLIIHALKNNFEADAYFVKVMVLSGLCSNDCPEEVKPFGVNQPGPYVMYTTVDSNGYLKNASAGQLSQSAHFSLQLPYTVLGLGRSANFLDHLFVGIPRQPGETRRASRGCVNDSVDAARLRLLSFYKLTFYGYHLGTLFSSKQPDQICSQAAVVEADSTPALLPHGCRTDGSAFQELSDNDWRQECARYDIRKQEWTAIIPNSQLIVIPYPHDKPRSWSAKLYLTPSNSVLLTAIALIGVCVFILVIIGILHWQEKGHPVRTPGAPLKHPSGPSTPSHSHPAKLCMGVVNPPCMMRLLDT
ncbi:hypothetical protein INR49_032954 [Caranx melampygus]|nr:hypothetical protein INR49_032954 [Caranx melampygus]